MLKVLSAIGFASALVLAPVVAFADDAPPAAAPAAAPAPMAHHHHHHHHHGHPIKHNNSHPGDAPAGDRPK